MRNNSGGNHFVDFVTAVSRQVTLSSQNFAIHKEIARVLGMIFNISPEKTFVKNVVLSSSK